LSESQPHPTRDLIEPQWREVSSYADLVGATEPTILWLGEAVDPPPPTDLLFPELASAEVRTHHFYKPTGRARIGLACLPQAIVSGPSFVGSPAELFRLGPMTAAYIDDLMTGSYPVGDRELAGKTERIVPGVSILLTHWNVETYGHWLLEGVPKLLLLRRLADDLPPFQILLPRSAPKFVQTWIDLVLPAARVAVYDDAVEYVRVETLFVPTVLFVSRGHHFHPELISLVEDLLPPPRHRPDTRLFVSRVQPNHFRSMSNLAEIEDIAVAEGLQLVRPETLPLSEQIALFAHATVIVGDFGSVMHNTLFSPTGALVLCLNMVTGLQSRIAELKRQRVGYLLPSGGEAVTHKFGDPPSSYHIDPQQFRAYVRECLAMNQRRAGTNDSQTAAPSRAHPQTTVKQLIRRGLKVVWWTVTLQLPRRLRAYRAYRSASREVPVDEYRSIRPA
jgi:capsular polysaccharide biosynthesis protein